MQKKFKSIKGCEKLSQEYSQKAKELKKAHEELEQDLKQQDSSVLKNNSAELFAIAVEAALENGITWKGVLKAKQKQVLQICSNLFSWFVSIN